MKIQPVIMSGGSGTRLWPLSRRSYPKQFLNLVSNRSLFQETVLRLSGDASLFSAPLIIAGRDHAELVETQLNEIGIQAADIILEPCPRNTAAVAAVAAAWTAEENPDALALLSPSDHHIEDKEAFHRAIKDGAMAAAKNQIVTFGIQPAHPHTGYGYIQSGDDVCKNVYKVAAFKEKPDHSTAEAYIKNGGYFWNAGLFLFNSKSMLNELKQHAPDISAAAKQSLEKCAEQGNAKLLNEEVFSTCPSDSVDYAIMEKTDKAAIVAPVDIGWTDIGSWSEASSEDTNHVISDCNNLTVRSSGPVIGAIGVDDLIIVATGDAVLVARKNCAQDVRKVVDELKRRGREDLL